MSSRASFAAAFASALCALAAPSTPATEGAAAVHRPAVHGFVGSLVAYDFNQPADHASFFPGVGTAAKRDNELAVNLAQVDGAVPAAPVGAKLALGFGNAADIVHATEPHGSATSPAVRRHTLQASLQYRTEVGLGLHDMLYVAATWLFFLLSWQYVRALARLVG